jgi:hypothetical protein
MTFWIVLIASVVFGMTYTVMGWKARDHLTEKASDSDRTVGWLFWWSFAMDKYDEEGKKLCKQGQVLAILLLGLYATWYFILLKK